MNELSVSRLAMTTAFAVLLIGMGVLAASWPGLLAARFQPVNGVELDTSTAAATAVIRSLALPWILAGLVGVLAVIRKEPFSPFQQWSAAIAAVIAYLSMQWVLADWTVDDAAITFAYSENLVRGHGLVLHPNHQPEEAYSNTLWMLILALVRFFGFEIDIAAKVLGAACGAACVLITMRVCATLLRPHAGYGPMLLCAVVVLGAPFVIWSISGLEHASQALLLTMIAALPVFVHRPVAPTAVCLGALMLLRPEAPLTVAGTVCIYLFERATAGRQAFLRLWPLVVVPAFVGAGLLAFRLWYFGAPFPNPYYAKASEANFLRLFNFVGGGWGYVFDWLATAATFMLVPLFLLGISWRASRLGIRLAGTLTLMQLVFVLYAGGDWMSSFRFLAPILPLLAMMVAAALLDLRQRFSPLRLEVASLMLAWFLGIGTVVGLQRFRAAPTTPTSVVTAIGHEFVSLARLLGIEHPTLAHHDAGGTSWGARIDLIDLGGLGNRAIARHMNDPAFIREYLLVVRRPTFVFGKATIFAAGTSGFHRVPEFTEQYVPVRFPGRDFMRADLSHVRRDLIRDVPGLSRVEENGRLVAVIVNNK